MQFSSWISILSVFLIFLLFAEIASADGGMRNSKNPAHNIYGVEKNAIEDSFGDRGKNIDRSDFSRTETIQTKSKKKEKESSDVPSFDDLPVPSAANPIVLPPVENTTEKTLDKNKWQEF